MRSVVGAVAVLAFCALTTAAAACEAPAELLLDDPRLPQTAQRLHQGLPLKIVAIGGGSTAGAAAGSPERAYPHQLQEELARRYPRSRITVLNKGVARQTTEDMVDRFKRDVLAERPDLVLWETGIVDAVRGTDLEGFTSSLQAGIERLHEAHVETMLIDMQFSRRMSSLVNFDRYLDALHRIADLDDVYVFPRYEIMRYWSEHGIFSLDAPGSRSPAFVARIYACLALRLADAIDDATR